MKFTITFDGFAVNVLLGLVGIGLAAYRNDWSDVAVFAYGALGWLAAWRFDK